MPDDKRTYEALTLNIQSAHPREKGKKEPEMMKKQSNKLIVQHGTFSKDVILRLIDWLEKE